MNSGVLFVCLGNICRSPAAEGIFRELIRREQVSHQFRVDSAGTGHWHVGSPPDSRMIEHAGRRGYDLTHLRARQVDAPKDFDGFDYILTMDFSNRSRLHQLMSSAEPARIEEWKSKIHMMTSFCRIHKIDEVPDPYHQDEQGFEWVLDILEDSCAELLAHIKQQMNR